MTKHKLLLMFNVLLLLLVLSFIGCDKTEPEAPPYDVETPVYEDGYLSGIVRVHPPNPETAGVVSGVVEIYEPHPDGPAVNVASVPIEIQTEVTSNPNAWFTTEFGYQIEYGTYDMIVKADNHIWMYFFDQTVQPSDTTYVIAPLSNRFFAQADTSEGYLPDTNDPSSIRCGNCHGALVYEWEDSAHKKSYEDLSTSDNTNPKCLSCHTAQPIALVSETASDLVDTRPLPRDTRKPDGVTCFTCHVTIENELLYLTGSYELHPQASPHQDKIKLLDLFDDSQMCAACHQYTPSGEDFSMYEDQQTYSEWENYHDQGGEETCQSCHMDLVERPNAVGTPIRSIRQHTFVGIDSQDLLRSAVHFEWVSGPPEEINFDEPFSFSFKLKNVGAGHNFPTGNYNRQVRVAYTLKDIHFGDFTFTRNTGDFAGDHLPLAPNEEITITVDAPPSIGSQPEDDFESRSMKVIIMLDPDNEVPQEDLDIEAITILTREDKFIKVNR